MKYSNEQIRGAILKTASLFERDPSSYRWMSVGVPDCSSPGCAIGWIGAHLGIAKGTPVCRVSAMCGFRSEHMTECFEPFYQRMDEFGYGWDHSAGAFAKNLRAYADKYFPTETAVSEDRQLVRWDQCAWQPKAVA